MAYLDEHPPASPQFRARREEPSGVVVVHTAENTPDYVAFDGGAEAVAWFISTRSDPGSYHDLGDSDSLIGVVRYELEAFHDGTGSNRHSYGVSVATRADVWPLAPKVWRDGAARQAATGAARYARWLHARRGIVIPPRRITRTQSEARVPGFISHAERDPDRRTDPGKGFPWTEFLAHYHRLTADLQATPAPAPPAPQPKEDDMRIIDCQGSPALLVRGDGTYKALNNDERNAWRAGGVEAHLVTKAQRDLIVASAPAPLDIDEDALAAALAAKLPPGAIDQAGVKALVHQALAEVEVKGHLELAED